MFLSGKGWGSLFKSQVAQKTKDYQCEECKNKFTSEKNLGTHKRKFHEDQNKPEAKSVVPLKPTNKDESLKDNKDTEDMEIDQKVSDSVTKYEDLPIQESDELKRLFTLQEKSQKTIEFLTDKVSALENLH